MSTQTKKNGRPATVISIILFFGVAALAFATWWWKYRGHDDKPDSDAQKGTSFVYEYVPPHSDALIPIYEQVRDMDLFRKLPEIREVDGMFILPAPLHFITAECGNQNAFYSQPKNEIVLCYELIGDILKESKTHADDEQTDKDFPVKYMTGVVRFVMLHELGHGVIRLLQLPITGREETAADELAAVVMLQYVDPTEPGGSVESSLLYAADYLSPDGEDTGDSDGAKYADAHEMGIQRYYNLLCTIYGSDPASFLMLVTDAGLPKDRAASCPADTARMISTWHGLLNSHLAPKYQMSLDERYEKSQNARLEQNKNVDNYVH